MKITKWENEIKQLNKDIESFEDDITNNFDKKIEAYEVVKDFTLPWEVVDAAVKAIRLLDEQDSKSESGIKSCLRSIKRREENIMIEEKIKLSKL